MLRALTPFALVLFSAAILTPRPLLAQETAAVSAKYEQRANELLEILQGSEKEEKFFAASFLKAVPIPQFRVLLKQLKTQYGEPRKIDLIVPASPYDGTVEVEFEKAVVAIRMVIDRQPPAPIVGLLITGAKVKGDDIQQIISEIKALPGQAGFEIADISGGAPLKIHGVNADKQFAIGSAFKLYVLGELSRSIAAGERRWDDVLPLDQKSLPSGMLQNWPDNTPLTLQTLATLMISVSDNSATDILLNEIGIEAMERYVRSTGHSQPDHMLPMLSTLQAFVMKMPRNDDLRKRFENASEQKQREILQTEQSRFSLDAVSISNLTTNPRHIDTIEWFAAPQDISKLLAKINRQDDPVAQSILSINPLIPPGDALRYDYLGAKGGSEPGVVSFAFLVKSNAGQTNAAKTYTVSGSWNNSKQDVDADKFLSLMSRLLNALAAQ